MEKKFKVIIAGGRDFNDYELLKSKCDNILKNKTNICIISGHANGADKLGENYSKERKYELISKPADWNNNGKRAGYLRNVEMAEIADALIAFWDGKSKGTKHMIDIIRERYTRLPCPRPCNINIPVI